MGDGDWCTGEPAGKERETHWEQRAAFREAREGRDDHFDGALGLRGTEGALAQQLLAAFD